MLKLMKKYLLLLTLFVSAALSAQTTTSSGFGLDPSDAQAVRDMKARMAKIREHRPTLALVLSGGGAKGAATVGALKYLEQIAAPLVRDGLLRATRGARGGYQLTHPPEDYSVGMILRTIEGSLSPVACVELGEGFCSRVGECAAAEVYRRIDEAIDNVVDGITLKDLTVIQEEKQKARQS